MTDIAGNRYGTSVPYISVRRFVVPFLDRRDVVLDHSRALP